MSYNATPQQIQQFYANYSVSSAPASNVTIGPASGPYVTPNLAQPSIGVVPRPVSQSQYMWIILLALGLFIVSEDTKGGVRRR